MANRYPKYRLIEPQVYELTTAQGLYSRRLAAGATCEYSAHSDTYIFESQEGVVPFFDGAAVETSPDAFEPVNYFVLIGESEHLDWFKEPAVRKRLAQVEWFWTATRQARKGDEALIYLTAPVSGIVGRVCFAGDAFENIGNMFGNSIMDGKWCVEIKFKEFFAAQQDRKIKDLRNLFARDWRWLNYPRSNTLIPNELVSSLLEFHRGE